MYAHATGLKAIGNCFERANLPTVTEEQRIAALTFAVVGAGPTGVECCAELRDFIEEVTDMCRCGVLLLESLFENDACCCN